MQVKVFSRVNVTLSRVFLVCGCALIPFTMHGQTQEPVPPPPSVQPGDPTVAAKPVRVSSAVMTGLLVKKHSPVYPEEARSAGLQGMVVLRVIVGADGMPKEVMAMSGPAILRKPAETAVKQWRWRPYLLNGSPVEAETTMVVKFP